MFGIGKKQTTANPTSVATPGANDIDTAITNFKTKYDKAKNEVSALNSEMSTIPGSILALRTSGGAEIEGMKKKLADAQATADADVTGYLSGLSKSIASIDVTSLETELQGLRTQEMAIKDVIKQQPNPNPSPSPTTVTNVSPPNSPKNPTTQQKPTNQTPSTQQKPTNQTPSTPTNTPITDDTMIPVSGTNMRKRDIIAFLNDKIKRTQPTYKKQYQTMLDNFKKANTIENAKNIVMSLRLTNDKKQFKGGKRTRKMSRKHGKRAKKHTRRHSRKH